MNIQGDVSSSLLMDNVYFEDVHLTTTGASAAGDGNADVSFKIGVPEIADNKMTIKMHCTVSIDGIMQLDICLVGCFASNDEEFLKRMIPNAVAIIFPYLRAQVSLMTAQPNLPTLVLPAININALLDTIGK